MFRKMKELGTDRSGHGKISEPEVDYVASGEL
jgi:hypothetical protein